MAAMSGIELRSLRRTIGALPFLGPAARQLCRLISPAEREASFSSSPHYWDRRYRLGGNSGAGSYGRLARFKAETINGFLAEHDIQSVVEFGSGDGAQLELAQYPSYIGIDVSLRAVEICRAKFATDASKRFFPTSSPEARAAKAELALSLDVIYHLVEDEAYQDYMSRLVAAALRFVCVYSSNVERPAPAPHIRHHCFTDWMMRNASSWKLVKKIPNPYPEDPQRPHDTSWADFYFFAKQ